MQQEDRDAASFIALSPTLSSIVICIHQVVGHYLPASQESFCPPDFLFTLPNDLRFVENPALTRVSHILPVQAPSCSKIYMSH